MQNRIKQIFGLEKRGYCKKEEVVLEILRVEIKDSGKYANAKQILGSDNAIDNAILHGEIKDGKNDLRARVLRKLNCTFFEEKLIPYNWKRLKLSREEFDGLVFLEGDWTKGLGIVNQDDTRRTLSTVTERFLVEPWKVQDADFLDHVTRVCKLLDKFNHGVTVMPLFLTEKQGSENRVYEGTYTIADGCHRALAYSLCLAEGMEYKPLDAYLGLR